MRVFLEVWWEEKRKARRRHKESHLLALLSIEFMKNLSHGYFVCTLYILYGPAP